MASKLDILDETNSSSNEDVSGNEESDLNSNSDKESANEDENSDTSVAELPDANAGWADSISKILRTKRPKGKKTLVLSKAKKLTDVIKKEKPENIGFQIDGEIKERKHDPSTLIEIKEESDEPVRKKRKKDIPSIRIKPNILDKDRERTLSKIATRGVVQLFNSVRMQQKDIDTRLQEAGPLERKRENVMKTIDKRAFLDVLMQKKSQAVDGNVKNELKDEQKKDSTWSVLRDDFMMGAKLKDWDKAEDDSDDKIDDMSDSD